jgi:hypothetical protein
MNGCTAVNKEVNITAMYFHNGRGFKSYPKRMEYNGNTYTFLESGLQYLIKRGQKMVQIFDMTDGDNNMYRLKFDEGEFNWTLVNITRNA